MAYRCCCARPAAHDLLRTTRSVRAPEQGQALAERIKPLLREPDAACLDAARAAHRIQGRLVLKVPGAVMPDILPPIIVAFQRRHPMVVLEIFVENSLVDVIAAGCDAVIRYGASIAKGMVSIPIGSGVQQIALAASPGYIAAHGQPGTPEHWQDATRSATSCPAGECCRGGCPRPVSPSSSNRLRGWC